MPATDVSISAGTAGAEKTELVAAFGIVGLGGVLCWLSQVHPALLPAWAPWDFSWPEFLATFFSLWWFLRGLLLTPAAARPPLWRTASFLLGVVLIYGVLQTRFEYWSQHMFFLTRIQHVVMHHIGPFLIALGAAGRPLRRGMPAPFRRLIDSRPVAGAVAALQQPLVAVVLFVGLFYLWLIPTVDLRAMLDPRVYALMNWSMVLDALLFWPVILDRRPKPPARLSYGVRAAMAWSTTFPAILIGAYLTSVDRDLYPFYTLCGRLFPSIGALTDQRFGGAITWVLPAMMGAIGALSVFWAFLQHEEELGA